MGVYEGAIGREEVREYVESSDCLILLGTFMTDINLGMFTAHLDQGRSIYATSEKVYIHYHAYENVSLSEFLKGLLAININPRKEADIPRPESIQPFEPVTGRKITIKYLFQRLNAFLDKNTVVIADTGDAMFAQKNICKLITKKKGGFVFTVKDNQRTLAQDIRYFFNNPSGDDKLVIHKTKERQKGRDETREVFTSTELTVYIDWPGVTHVWMCRREVVEKGKARTECAYGIARLLNSNNPAKELNNLIRGHWLIENSLHRQRDVQFNEDRSAIRKKNGPQVMSILGNLITSIFNQGKVTSFSKVFRRFSAQPRELFAFLGLYRFAYTA